MRLKEKGYRRLILLKKDFGYNSDGSIPHAERHKHRHQLPRRAHLARVRNHLVVRCPIKAVNDAFQQPS